MTVVPLVISYSGDSADELIDLMAKEWSAKEVVMAFEEIVESLEQTLQTDDDDGGRTRAG